MRIRPFLFAPLLGLALTGQSPPPSSNQPAAPASTPAAREAIQAAAGHALQGEMAPAVAVLRSVPGDQFFGSSAALRACVLDRFGSDAHDAAPATLPPVATRALALYRAYWRAGLLDPASRPAAEETLRASLATLLGLPAASSLDATEAPLVARLEAEGLHVLAGITPPFRELMLWRGQTSELREIALPEGVHRARVFMLHDFASLGWAGYATCERNYSGGWVRPEGIYAVTSGWGDLAGEAFRVSFLAHETQHFADKGTYGELPSWELEYRAKLAELALAETSQATLLAAFSQSQGDDQAVPHPYANRRVLAALRARLGLPLDVSFEVATPQAIRAAALAELRADSARRADPSPPAPAPRR